jgi:hypothetical protein
MQETGVSMTDMLIVKAFAFVPKLICAVIGAILAHAKLFGCKVGAVTLTPRTTSADSWATVANQTPMSGYTTAGIRGQFNAWLFAQKALGNLDFIVDVNSVAADTTNPDVFKAGFSYDGTHWGAASVLTVAAYAKTVLLKLEV